MPVEVAVKPDEVKPGSVYAGCVPQRVDAVNTLPRVKVDKVWAALYGYAKIAGAAEETKLALRCAVYCYLAVNGTSPEGSYTGIVISGKGTELQAAKIPECAGKFDVRRFMRGNAKESVDYFHETDVLAGLEPMVTKCAQHNLRPSEALALCDWLDGAQGLTPVELEAQARLKAESLMRARRSRGGHSVEELRDEDVQRGLEAQGPDVKAPGKGW
jgi:hypothetical protein